MMDSTSGPRKPHDVLIEATVEYSATKVDSSKPQGCLLFVSEADPEHQGRTLELTLGEAVIGRDDTCDLVLNHESVSRNHARLVVRPDGVLVEDLDSTNGIRYLGKRIERAVLKPGSRIGIGECSIDLLPLTSVEFAPISSADQYGDMVGTSLSMRRLFCLLETLETSDAPVLVEGETGTGKELVARALHEKGRRASSPFMVVDCGNLPSELIESELFGHCRGAFTGAVSDRVGTFELADGGTVFLDEIGELPTSLQPKLLRVLETGEIKRLGAAKYLPVNMRLIAASKRDLAHEVEQKRFRDDLYYRIAVVKLQMPPLRDRRDDIPLLVKHLVSQMSGQKPVQLSSEIEEFMMRHSWPGNVRELRNVLQRILALRMERIRSPDEIDFLQMNADAVPCASSDPRLALGSFANRTYKEAREKVLQTFEQLYLRRLVAESKGNLSAAARAASLDRAYLRRLLKKHRLY